jgi:hypothetical protein
LSGVSAHGQLARFSALAVVGEGLLGLVVCVSRGAELVRAGLAAGSAASLKGTRDLGVAPRGRDASSAGAAAEADAG